MMQKYEWMPDFNEDAIQQQINNEMLADSGMQSGESKANTLLESSLQVSFKAWIR